MLETVKTHQFSFKTKHWAKCKCMGVPVSLRHSFTLTAAPGSGLVQHTKGSLRTRAPDSGSAGLIRIQNFLACLFTLREVLRKLPKGSFSEQL